MTAYDELTEALRAPLDAYGDELAKHRRIAPDERVVDGRILSRGACACGWRARRELASRAVANRAAGLHVSAAERRASKAYDAEVARLLAVR